jgi:hypothetical protein
MADGVVSLEGRFGTDRLGNILSSLLSSENELAISFIADFRCRYPEYIGELSDRIEHSQNIYRIDELSGDLLIPSSFWQAYPRLFQRFQAILKDNGITDDIDLGEAMEFFENTYFNLTELEVYVREYRRCLLMSLLVRIEAGERGKKCFSEEFLDELDIWATFINQAGEGDEIEKDPYAHTHYGVAREFVLPLSLDTFFAAARILGDIDVLDTNLGLLVELYIQENNGTPEPFARTRVIAEIVRIAAKLASTHPDYCDAIEAYQKHMSVRAACLVASED